MLILSCLVGYLALFPSVPARIRGITAVFNVVTILCMGLGRVLFTRAARKRRAQAILNKRGIWKPCRRKTTSSA